MTELLRRVSRGRLSRARIERILRAAKSSLGEPMTEHEAARVRSLAHNMLHYRQQLDRLDEQIATYVEQTRPELASLRRTLGAVTTAALVADLGDPASYGSAPAFEKALGLNLKERSSGKKVGQLKITKRGPPRARRYLFLAALRLVQSDPLVRAWYQARAGYKEKHKLKAVVAVMRKLARSMVHLARGEAFDADKLFDRRKLGVPDAAPSLPCAS
ncbi:MAG: transposase [Sandaracinaceae bacterium]|nr:transposase [Sandaracinaceae bacterium]